MLLTRGVEQCVAFCVFDLQIKWPQFRVMRFAIHTLTRFQSQGLIVRIRFSLLVVAVSVCLSVVYCCPTLARDLIILITAVIPLLPVVSWHTNKPRHVNIPEA